MVALEPGATWGQRDILLLECFNALNYIAWTKTEKAAKKGKPPKPLEPPELARLRKRASMANRDIVAMDMDDIKSLLSKPRK